MQDTLAQRGFATILLLVLLPLLISVTGVMAAGFLAIKCYGTSLHLCRTGLLEAQSEFALGLKNLKLLNPQADALLAQEKQTLIMIQTSVYPPARAAAMTRLAMIRNQQQILAIKQQLIIGLTNAKALSILQKTKEDIRSRYADQVALLSEGKHSSLTILSQYSRMQIQFTPAHAIAPHIEASSRAPSQQILRLRWNFDLAEMLPTWIPTAKSNLRTQAQCASTVKEKEGQWQSKLAPDRP